MSVITDLLLFTPLAPDGPDPIVALNEWCDAHAHGQRFSELETGKAGGDKVFTNRVFACAGNYFPLTEFLEAFGSNVFGWNEYDAARTICIVDHENADEVRAIRADGERMHGRWGLLAGWHR